MKVRERLRQLLPRAAKVVKAALVLLQVPGVIKTYHFAANVSIVAFDILRQLAFVTLLVVDGSASGCGDTWWVDCYE